MQLALISGGAAQEQGTLALHHGGLRSRAGGQESRRDAGFCFFQYAGCIGALGGDGHRSLCGLEVAGHLAGAGDLVQALAVIAESPEGLGTIGTGFALLDDAALFVVSKLRLDGTRQIETISPLRRDPVHPSTRGVFDGPQTVVHVFERPEGFSRHGDGLERGRQDGASADLFVLGFGPIAGIDVFHRRITGEAPAQQQATFVVALYRAGGQQAHPVAFIQGPQQRAVAGR